MNPRAVCPWDRESRKSLLILRVRCAIVLAAGFMVHLTLGTIYTFGNLNPYIVSYVRQRSHPRDLTGETVTWIFALNWIGQGTSMFLGGWLERKIGPRLTTLAGSWLMSAGVLLSYFAIKVSFWLLLLTYGLMFGVGVGIAYIGPLSCAMRWVPRWRGVAGGCIVAGFGLGALIFDEVQSRFINPRNVKPTDDGIFTEKELLSRVPFVFLILGAIYAVVQFIGSMLIVNPPNSGQEDSQEYLTLVEINDPAAIEIDDYFTESDQPAIIQATTASSEDDQDLKDGVALVPRTEKCDNINKHITIADEDCVNINKHIIIGEDPRTLPEVAQAMLPSEIVPEISSPETNVAPLKMLRMTSFYHLWSMMLLAGFSVSFIASLFKVFGLTFINDDQFLTTVGSVSAIFNFAGRITWGLVADKLTYKLALVLWSGMMTLFLLTFYATSVVGKPLFFVWMCILFFCVGGVFSLFPASIAHSFGRKHMSINYGLLFTSQSVSSVISALLLPILHDVLHWIGLILLISGVCVVNIVLTLLHWRCGGRVSPCT